MAYAALLLVTSIGALLLASPALFTSVVSRSVGAADYAALIWSRHVACDGGWRARAAALEADSTVREAAYGYRQDVQHAAEDA